MIFLPATLTLTLVLILSSEELGVFSADNSDVDGRFSFEDSKCPPKWKRRLELEPEVERPSLELWARNDTILLDGPSQKVLHMGEEYQESYFGAGTVKMVCKAPYPVILLAAYEDGTLGNGVEAFHVTTNNMYDKSSYNFETHTWLRLSFNFGFIFRRIMPNNVYYCQALDNPCLKSKEKLFFFNDSGADSMTFTLRLYNFASDFSNTDDHSDPDSNSNSTSHLNPNSSSISPSEFRSIFRTNLNFNFNLYVNQSIVNSSSSSEVPDHDQIHTNENNTNDSESECEAFFYYEEFRDYEKYSGEGRINLSYRCEFLDGTPGTVRVLRRCSRWARCRFLVAARKQKPKNCWRPYISGKTCLNCTAQKLGMGFTEPIIPHCRTYIEGDERDEPVYFPEEDETEKDDTTEDPEPEIEDDVENPTTDVSTEHFEAESEDEANTENYHYVEYSTWNDDMVAHEKPTSVTRSVEGTPLYVGFPPPGLEIQRPFIRTDAYDQDDLEESTLVRMNPFPELQLFNTTIQITCDSNEWYTSKIFIFGLQFQSNTEKGNQNNLQFLPVDKTTLEVPNFGKGVLQPNSQTVTLHLNRKDITRIFCFTGVQNSYKWVNASRPVRVLEYPEFYKPSECLNVQEKSSNLLRPQLSVYYSQPTLGGFEELNEEYPQLLLNDGDSSSLTCSTGYPIQVISSFNNTAGGGKFSNQRTQFDTFQNHSSYSFKLEDFEFKPKSESHFYRCQSLENPCLHRSIFYSYVPGPTRQLKFEHVPQNESDNSTVEGRRFKSNSDSDLEFGSPINYRECEVLFFYKELQEFPGYEFRCEFPMEEEGTVNFHYCNSLNDCGNLYRNRRQPKVCWRRVESWRRCKDCEENRSGNYRPFVATCKTYFSKDGELSVKESTLGSFAIFGLPNQTTGIAPIYFSNEEIDSKATIVLEPFEKYQLFNTSLNVTCVSSAYYMSSADVHIGKFYKGRNKLQLLKFDEFNAVKFKVDPEQHEWRITRTIKLGNDPALTHIFCIGITWINFRQPVNFSREIHLQGPEAPKILLDAGNFEEKLITNNHLQGPRNSQTSDEEQEYEFLVNSENKTLVCQGHGFPPPKIQWATTAKNAPNPGETEVNSSHSVSRIFLPVIDAGVKGTYICTAMNSHGKATASMKISLKYPVNKSIVAIVTTSILIVTGLALIMALLWRRIRGLKKVLRDLTPEEVEEFHLGSRTVNPEDPHAEIYALPYDWSLEVPRELIELDETRILGTGEFGLVRPGYIKEGASRAEKRLVAIKQAKPKLGAEEFKNILSEIKVMSYLKQHENVLQILAACTTSIKKCQVLVVMEFCEMGDLYKYVSDRKYIFEDIFAPRPDPASGYSPMSVLLPNKFSTHSLIEFSLGITNGMNFLRQKRVVHGDLAARNVLLTKTLEVKVSDFGCSTHLINYASYSKIEPTVIPWRWFSIEALKEMKLSFKSDVWAFGVLLYELFTMGELPYSGDELSPEFIQDLTNGKRLEQPEYTNDEIYALMTDCWQKEPSERPTFQEIYDRLLLIKNELS